MSPPPKKAKGQKSAGKVLLSVFVFCFLLFFGGGGADCRGVILTGYLEKGQTIAGVYYCTLLKILSSDQETAQYDLKSRPCTSSLISSCGWGIWVIMALKFCHIRPVRPILLQATFSYSQNLKKKNFGLEIWHYKCSHLRGGTMASNPICRVLQWRPLKSWKMRITSDGDYIEKSQKKKLSFYRNYFLVIIKTFRYPS